MIPWLTPFILTVEKEQVYCGLDELEQAIGYLTTVIVKEHVVQ